jgi:hypothetical protein
MQEESDELGALTSNLQLGDDVMSIETYIQMEGEQISELELEQYMSWWMLLRESIMHKPLILMLIYS